MKTHAQEILESEEIKRLYGVAAVELTMASESTVDSSIAALKRCREKLFGNIGGVVEYQDLVDMNIALLNLTYARANLKRVFERA